MPARIHAESQELRRDEPRFSHSEATPDMPLLWELRDLLGMTGTKFGSRIARFGACRCVWTEWQCGPARCERSVITIEAIGATPTIMSAVALLKKTPKPNNADIDAELDRVEFVCRYRSGGYLLPCLAAERAE